MAWSVVQSASVAGLSSVAAASVRYGAALSSGTVMLAAVAAASSHTISTVTDTLGNSFALVGRKTQASLADISLWALATPAADIGATKPGVTATLASGTGDISILVQEVFGIQPAADGTAGTLGGAATGSTGSPSYTSGASSEYLISVYGDDGGPTAWAKPSALTADVNSLNNQPGANIAIAYGNSTHGTEAGSWTLTGTAAEWGTILVALKLTTASPARGLLPAFL